MRRRLNPVEIELADPLDVIQDRRELLPHPLELGFIEGEARETGDVDNLFALQHHPSV